MREIQIALKNTRTSQSNSLMVDPMHNYHGNKNMLPYRQTTTLRCKEQRVPSADYDGNRKC